MLERYAVKVARTVLRGGSDSNVTPLPDHFDGDNQLANKLPEEVEKRERHVVEEFGRSNQTEALLEAGNVQNFGKLMNEHYVSLHDMYEVSCPELNEMMNVAQALDGCYGARLTGAGFGGCTVNLVAKEQAKAFAQALAKGYENEAGLHPEIYICNAVSGANIIGEFL